VKAGEKKCTPVQGQDIEYINGDMTITHGGGWGACAIRTHPTFRQVWCDDKKRPTVN